MVGEDVLTAAYTGATSPAHWERLFQTLRSSVPAVDRICAAVQLDRWTAYLPLVAQVPELDLLLGRDGLYADREMSRTFEVIAEGRPCLVAADEWERHADLAFYGAAVRSNVKFPIALGVHPAIWNVWSRTPNAFTAEDLALLMPVAVELGRSPFRLELPPVGLAMRRARELGESRARLLAA